MTLSPRAVAGRALRTSLSIGTSVVTTGFETGSKVARRIPAGPATTVLGKAKDIAEPGVRALATTGATVVARVRGVPTGAEQQAAVEQALDPFSLPEPVAELVDDVAPGATLSHAELPLEDYDHLTLGSLRARIRRLDAPSLVQLRDYERAHGNRLPVLLAFDNRLKAIAAEAPGAEQATLVEA